jgi:hypothetical protein
MNKTLGIRDIRVECGSSMRCLAASIEGWRVLDDAGKWMMLRESGVGRPLKLSIEARREHDADTSALTHPHLLYATRQATMVTIIVSSIYSGDAPSIDARSLFAPRTLLATAKKGANTNMTRHTFTTNEDRDEEESLLCAIM